MTPTSWSHAKDWQIPLAVLISHHGRFLGVDFVRQYKVCLKKWSVLQVLFEQLHYFKVSV